MGCPKECILGDDIVFSITTHDPDTGQSANVSATPTYRIYEDVNETAISNGIMDDGTGAGQNEFDDGNTTGHYLKLIACTIVNGYEVNKNYTIYVSATVDSDPGAISFTFKVIAAPITVADIIAGITEGGYDLQEMMRIIFAVMAGLSDGAKTATQHFRDSADSKNRITATVDVNGNRTALTLDGT